MIVDVFKLILGAYDYTFLQIGQYDLALLLLLKPFVHLLKNILTRCIKISNHDKHKDCPSNSTKHAIEDITDNKASLEVIDSNEVEGDFNQSLGENVAKALNSVHFYILKNQCLIYRKPIYSEIIHLPIFGFICFLEIFKVTESEL